jgi:large subunit ribosomal protein L17
MRHGDKVNNLGRKKGHRVALLKNMSISLITHKRIKTTIAKAKALRLHIEPLISKSKVNTTHSRRVVFSYLQNKDAVNELFSTVAEKVASRPGGYTRVIRTGFRRSDGSEMAIIELVDFNLEYSGSDSPASKKSKRSRRGKSAKKTTGASEGATAVAATTAAVAAAAVLPEQEVDEAAVTLDQVPPTNTEAKEVAVEEVPVVVEASEAAVIVDEVPPVAEAQEIAAEEVAEEVVAVEEVPVAVAASEVLPEQEADEAAVTLDQVPPTNTDTQEEE